jgi:hypothetical protein
VIQPPRDVIRLLCEIARDQVKCARVLTPGTIDQRRYLDRAQAIYSLIETNYGEQTLTDQRGISDYHEAERAYCEEQDRLLREALDMNSTRRTEK